MIKVLCVMPDGREEERTLDHFEVDSNMEVCTRRSICQTQRPVPVHSDDEVVLWVIGDARPHIMPGAVRRS